MRPKDNSANIKNPNKGQSGTNKQYDQNQGNRGKQMNPQPKADDKPQAPRKKGK